MLAFLRLSRLKFLVGGLLGGAFGTAVAAFERGSTDWAAYALAQSTITALHLMTHYSNEYFDRECDPLCVRTPFSGGSGALGSGGVPARTALLAAIACAAAGLTGALFLIESGRTVCAAIALVIAVLAWTYSAPPLRLCARGLGEIDAALVVGMLVPLCAYAAQAGRPSALVVVSCIPATAAMFAMMIAVELPDAEADRATGKRNLVVRSLPQRRRALLLGPFAAVATGTALAVVAGAPPTIVPLIAVAFPGAARLEAALRRRSGATAEIGGELAGRGVAFFVLVLLGSLLGYLAALR